MTARDEQVDDEGAHTPETLAAAKNVGKIQPVVPQRSESREGRGGRAQWRCDNQPWVETSSN